MIGNYGDTTIITGPYHGYGDAVTDLLKEYAPVIRGVTEQIVDPRRQVAVLSAKLQTAIAQGKPQSVILELQGKLAAAQAAVAEEKEFEKSRRDISNLAKVGIVTGIGVGISIIALLLVRAFRSKK